MLYTNDMAVPANQRALMIVPFPNPTNATEFVFVDVGQTKKFRTTVNSHFARHEKHARSQALNASFSDSRGGYEMAAVVQVGNYQCSAVPSADHLTTSIDWSRFTVPADLRTRLAVLQDKSIIPADCGFVVAEAVRNVVKDGFGIAFPGRHGFFPTCHEGNASGVHDFDVCCYGFNVTLPPTLGTVSARCSNTDTGLETRGRGSRRDIEDSIAWVPGFRPYPAPGLRLFDDFDRDADDLGNVLTQFPCQGKSSLTGAGVAFAADTRVSFCSFTHLKGSLKNQNVVGTVTACEGPLPLPPVPEAPPLLSSTVSESRLRLAAAYGQYYCPASRHYPHMLPSACVVSCDKCGKQGLDRCIGYENIDLCMECVATFSAPAVGVSVVYPGPGVTPPALYPFLNSSVPGVAPPVTQYFHSAAPPPVSFSAPFVAVSPASSFNALESTTTVPPQVTVGIGHGDWTGFGSAYIQRPVGAAAVLSPLEELMWKSRRA